MGTHNTLPYYPVPLHRSLQTPPSYLFNHTSTANIMGPFSKKEEPMPAHQSPPTAYNDAPHGHHDTRHSSDTKRKGGLLSRNRRSSSLSSSDEERRRGNMGGLFNRNREPEDPSI